MDDERTVTMTDHTILLVDDDRSLLEMLLSIFRRAGYPDILTASSGTEALRTWREAQPRLIVLDVMLPDMDGFCVLREIRRTSRVPVLMLTARGGGPHRGAGDRCGRLPRQAVSAQGIAAPGRRNSQPRLPGAKREGRAGRGHRGHGQCGGVERRQEADADRQGDAAV